MSHKVLSLRYRPQRFDELRGQASVARILRQALVSGRVGHAYLFVGPRGVGKTTTARIFARALNCAGQREPGDVEPCGECASCRDIAAGSDLDVVEMDAASNNAVDDVRALREQVGYATARSPYRIWIVDEVHMLSLPAFNAFLKTLEEPPERVKFLFCTTEEHKLPDTFRSRCQRVEFRPIAEVEMAERLRDLAQREGAVLEDGLAEAIAQGALGGLRDAESMLEQLLAASAGGPLTCSDLDALGGRAPRELLESLLKAVERGSAAEAVDAADACLAAGSKPGVLVEQWLDALRARMLAAARDSARPKSARTGVARWAQSIDVLLAKRAHLKNGADGALIVQVAAIELARLPDARDLDALVRALRGEEARADAAPAAAAEEPTEKPPPRAASSRGPGPAWAPPPGAAVSAAAVPADGDAGRLALGTLLEVEQAWGRLVRVAARRDARLGEALEQATPVALHGDRLRVRLPAAASAQRVVLLRREMQLAFGQAAREHGGTYLHLELEDGLLPSGVQAEVAPELRAHPVIQRVAERTGGRLLHVERLAPGAAAEPGDADLTQVGPSAAGVDDDDPHA